MANDKVLLGTRVSPEMRDAFRLLAAREKRSMSAELQVLVERQVAQFEKEVVQAN